MRRCVPFLICLAVLGHAVDIKRNVKDSEVSEGPSETNLGPTIKNVNKFNRPSALSSSKRESEEEEEQPQQSLKLPKINNQGTQCYDVPSSKRSVDLETDLELAKPRPYEKYKRRRSPYGIVYNQGRPIGILEPISKVYEFEDYKGQDQMDEAAKVAIDKRGLQSEEEEASLIEGNGRYANVLNSFKIGNRIKMKQLGDEVPFERKRERLYNKRSAELPKGARNLNEIEDNLQEIMGDLGLVDEAEKLDDKRETAVEDEDLENGPNKIGLIKESHSYERNKKEDCPGKTFGTDLSEKASSVKPYRKTPEAILNSDEAPLVGDKKSKKAKISDYRSEGEAFIRSKRQQNDIMKGLETSGDLTVSGNKSPLASSTANDNETKQKAIARDNEEKREKQMSSAENQEYEKRLQRNIENKISEIKEEVKREIKVLKGKEGEKAKGEEKKKREGEGKKSRKKRFLSEMESKEIDPLALETDLAVHIRRRRHVDEEKAEEDEDKRVTWTEVSGLDKREEREKPLHDPKSYKFEPRSKKMAEENQKEITGEGFVKRSDESGKVVEGSSGFRDVQNRAVAEQADTQAAHALAARDSAAKSAHAASKTPAELNAEKLERLVSDSTSLTESIKSERGARSGDSPHIEVELHNKDDLKPKEIAKLHEEKKSAQKEEETKRNDEELEVEKRSPQGQELVYKEDKSKLVREVAKKNPIAITSEVIEGKGKDVEEKKEDAKIAEEEGLKTSDVKESVLKRSIHENKNIRREARNNKEKIVPDLTQEDIAEEEGLKTSDAKESVLKRSIYENKNIRREGRKDKEKIVPNLAQEDIAEEEGLKTSDAKESVLKRSIHENKNVRREVRNNKEKIVPDLAQEDIAEDEGLKTSDVKESVMKRSMHENEIKREGRSNKDESKIVPDLTLEDMQKLDSENTVKRRKRTSRIKRDYSEPNNMQFRTYSGDEEDADEESDEFDDDNFDDRTANLIRKRDIYEDFDGEDYVPIAPKEVAKRNAKNFVAELNSDVYENPNYLYNTRKKRDYRLGQNVAVSERSVGRKKREGLVGPMMKHFEAAKERNLESVDRNYRRKRLEKLNLKQSKDQTITGLSESDIFGGLPQSYEGELSRFKRVKRENNLDKGS